ncbi:MAG TPA: DUF362 domain-containing protein [Candidatus Omnitrophota bacterium]|nr:DUF362 domain-containing protein [Candidatus Omnitrophota bacterium]
MIDVSLSACRDYDESRVLEAITRSVDLLGGMKYFVKPGQKVLLKVNMLGANPPEKGVTTHPSILKAVIELVKQAGGIPVVGDSPGYGNPQKAFEVCGFKAVCDRAGAATDAFKEQAKLKLAEGGMLGSFTVARAALEADVIINLPKLKTHTLTGVTAATKNMFGCIPGLLKSEWHVKLSDRDSFSKMLLELRTALKPALSIVDAVMAMEGPGGPAAGPLRNIGLIAASTDTQALDHTLFRVLNIDPATIPTISNDPEFDPARINVVGEKVEAHVCTDFDKIVLPNRSAFPGPVFVQKLAKDLLAEKPVLVRSKCTHCRACGRVCHSKAIFFPSDIPCFDYGKCIRCFCCAEMCPSKAIEVRRGWLGKLLLRLAR